MPGRQRTQSRLGQHRISERTSAAKTAVTVAISKSTGASAGGRLSTATRRLSENMVLCVH
jgi:hypothetical protein